MATSSVQRRRVVARGVVHPPARVPELATTSYTRNALNQYTLTRVPTTPVPLHQSYEFDADGNLAQTWAAGDMNCDGMVSIADVNAFQVSPIT